MSDDTQSILALIANIRAIVPIGDIIALGLGAVVLIMVLLIVRSKGNDLELYQFISSRNADGKQVADPDKLGKLLAYLLGPIVVMRLAGAVEHLDALGYSLVLLTYFAFASGPAAWAAYMRYKTGQPTEKEKS